MIIIPCYAIVFKVLFEDCEGNTHEVISVYESDAYSSYAEYSCVIKIGVPGQDTYKREGIDLPKYEAEELKKEADELYENRL